MKAKHLTTVATYGCLALGGVGSFALPDRLPVVSDCLPAPQDPHVRTIVLRWSALNGRECAGGIVGRTERVVADFEVGHYLLVNSHLVIRARGEIDSAPPLGSPLGNAADLCLDAEDHGLGVGSFVRVRRPGSKQISGGGDEGSELVSFICSGDDLLTDPRVVPARSVAVQVSDFEPEDADVSLVLHAIDGLQYVFPPEIVESALEPVAPRTWNLRFADLPGVSEIPALERFDVRSGWWDPDRDRLSGGHFWLTAVSFDAEPLSPTHVVFRIYD